MFLKNFVVILVLFVENGLLGQDFGYPERAEDDVGKQNAANRKPVFAPGRCKENELLYPGDQADDWICDCSPGFLFHPSTDKCYSAYKKGPCPEGNFLILQKGRVMPECSRNPCRKDGQVMVQGQCYELGKAGPCPDPDLSYVLGVNATTLDLACIRLSVALETRFDDSEANSANTIPSSIKIEDTPLCPKGCKRHIDGTCREAEASSTTEYAPRQTMLPTRNKY